MRNAYIAMYIKYKDISLVPKYLCDMIFDDIQILFEIQSEHLQKHTSSYLTMFNFNNDYINPLVNQIEINNLYQSTHNLYKRASKKREYFTSCNLYVPPIEIYLGDDGYNKKEYLHYVPVPDMLKALLSRKDIRDAVKNNKKSDDNKIRSFKDGSAYRNNEFFASDENKIYLKFFVDEFEPANPIADSRTKYKIYAIYYKIGNIDEMHQSSVYTIQLALLSKDYYFNKYSAKTIFKPLIDDLQKLETDGIVVSDGINEFIYKAVVAVVIGDNLALNGVGGFVECFNGKTEYFCRYCLGNADARQNCYRDNDFTTRLKLNYDESVIAALAKNKNDFGIKTDSPFNDLNYFHVINGMAVDVMHDILEGIAQTNIAILTSHLNQVKVLDLKSIFVRLNEFQYGRHDGENQIPLKLFDLKIQTHHLK